MFGASPDLRQSSLKLSLYWPIRKAANSPACHAGDDRGSTGIGRTSRGGAAAASNGRRFESFPRYIEQKLFLLLDKHYTVNV